MALDLASLPSAQIKVSEFISHDKTWDVSKLSPVLPINLVRVVYALMIPLTDIQDYFYRGLIRKVEYCQLNLLHGWFILVF